jgi:hypothetical protein
MFDIEVMQRSARRRRSPFFYALRCPGTKMYAT